MSMEGNMEYVEKIVDIETGTEIIKPYSDEQLLEVKAAEAEAKLQAEATAKIEAAKEALFEKLGITKDEAKLLFS